MSSASVVIMYVMEIGCLLLSVLGVFGACKGKRWCLILVKNKNKKSYICAGIYLKRKYACVKMCSKFVLCVCVCVCSMQLGWQQPVKQ